MRSALPDQNDALNQQVASPSRTLDQMRYQTLAMRDDHRCEHCATVTRVIVRLILDICIRPRLQWTNSSKRRFTCISCTGVSAGQPHSPPEAAHWSISTISAQRTMDIKNPRRILALGAPGSGVLSILKGKSDACATRFDC